MTPQEYQQILLLRKPLKALALCCISGSLSGAHTLSNYLVDNPVERQEASQIIPAVLDTLLALDEVPHALDFGTFELVQTALLLLSAFSHLSLIAEEEAIAAGRFVKHEATIFSWLSFLQRHLFGPPAPNLLSLIEDARPDFLMVMILVTQTLTNYLHRPQPEIDFTRCEYITNTTFELWSLLQRTSYDDCHRTTMLVTNYTSGVVTALIENSLNNQSHHFVDKIGGISSVVPLFLSAVDYYWNHTVSQLNRRVPPYAFASLEQLLCDALTLVNSHHFRDHVDIPSSVRYLTSAIHWVLKTRVHILERLPQDFNNGYLAPRTYIQSYVKFITTSLSHPRYYLVWNDLDMRVMKTLRSGLPSDYDPLSKLSGVFSLLANCLTFNSAWFPTILRKTMKLRSLPTLPVYQRIWDAFDNNLHAFQLSLKGAMMIAEQYDSCRTAEITDVSVARLFWMSRR